MDPIESAPEEMGGEEAVIESVLGKLGDFDDEGAAAEPQTETEGEKPAEAAPSDVKDGTAQDQSQAGTEAQPPAIEPPPGLTDDEREVFKSLPPAAQEVFARRERDRTNELRRGQDEIANEKKAVAQERQRYAQQLETYIQLSQAMDPVLAEGMKTDWVQLSQDNPAEAQTKWFQFQQRQSQLQAAINQRNALAAQQQQDHLAREGQTLLDKVPEYKADPSKVRPDIDRFRKAAVDYYGYTPQEVSIIPDHRQVLVLRDAVAYRQLMAERKQVADKKVVPVSKVQKPGAGGETLSAGERVKAMTQRAAKTDNLHERAALIAAALD